VQESDFVNGASISQFEDEFADYLGSQFVIAVGNGTDALEIMLQAAGVGPGMSVVVPSLTFVATLEAIVRVGATPILVDVSEDGLLSMDHLADALRLKPSAVLPVHLHGRPIDVSEIIGIVGPDILVFEDCAQSHGASVHGVMTGNLALAGAFSFYPGKNLGCWGDGGCISTDSSEIADLARRLRNHGRRGKHDHLIIGRNSRLDSIQAYVLLAKLGLLDEANEQRRRVAELYSAGLTGDSALRALQPRPGTMPVWHQYVVEVGDRHRFQDALKDEGIPTGVHYPYALPDLPISETSIVHSSAQAERLAKRMVSLPMGEHLTLEDASRVIASVNRVSRLVE